MKKRLSSYNEADKKIISLNNFLESILFASISHQMISEYYDISSTNLEDGVLKGSTEKIFGLSPNSIEINCTGQFSLSESQFKQVKKNFEKSNIYDLCQELYEYAVQGKPMKNHWVDVIEDIDPYFQNISGADYSHLNDSVRVIIDLARLRLYIDESDYTEDFTKEFDEFQVIALMARLDERTIKNAHSQGLFNGTHGEFDYQSLKLWLSTKRGFIPTQGKAITPDVVISNVRTANEFGSLLLAQRLKLGNLFDLKVFPTKHFLFTKKTVDELESGFFNLPLNVVKILANSYLIDEKELLNCIMKVFFSNELRLIHRDNKVIKNEK